MECAAELLFNTTRTRDAARSRLAIAARRIIAEPPSTVATGPLSQWTEAWPTQPAISYYTLAVNRRGAGKGVSGNPSPASHEFNDSRRLIASVDNPKVSGSAWGSVDRPVDTFGRSEARLLSYKPRTSVSQSVSSRSPRALTTPPSQRRRPRTSPGSTQSRVRPPTTPPGLRGEGS
jgi:hypothetical protein